MVEVRLNANPEELTFVESYATNYIIVLARCNSWLDETIDIVLALRLNLETNRETNLNLERLTKSATASIPTVSKRTEIN